MTNCEQRLNLLSLIGQACTGGARLKWVCDQIGLFEHTVQRWQHPDGKNGDRRVSGLHERVVPADKLSDSSDKRPW